MITRAVLDERVREWGLRDDVVEKDYVLGWLLWGIGANKPLGDSWVFKGGTCLKKCYIETYCFSEDNKVQEWGQRLGQLERGRSGLTGGGAFPSMTSQLA